MTMVDSTNLPSTVKSEQTVEGPLSRADLMTLTKARLSALVVITTFFGYLLGARAGAFQWMTLVHTLIGTTLCAFAAAVYNQIMEMEVDAKMERTADRPLAAKRMAPELAFGIGWVLAAVGILHLAMTVNPAAAWLAAATIVIYIFVYTPLKTRSTSNTLVGAVSGALPPVIGWVAADQPVWQTEALFLFGLLFFWQLPHFLAINWMYRTQYEQAGFVMWSNGDEAGSKTSVLALTFSLAMFLFMLFPFFTGDAAWIYLVGTVALTGGLLYLSWVFYRTRQRQDARKLFFSTLLYLPLMLIIVLLDWR
jgi:protoheme IX farnesyltransferase